MKNIDESFGIIHKSINSRRRSDMKLNGSPILSQNILAQPYLAKLNVTAPLQVRRNHVRIYF